MASGTVKWFNNKKGFGFIVQNTGEEVFVHQTSIQSRGYRTLNEGEAVIFEVEPGERGLKALNVQRSETSHRRQRNSVASPSA